MKKQVLSCIQPTGDMHIGNYFGAIKNWVDLQDEYECRYGIVDYHAITMPYDAKKLRINTWEMALNLMAVGIKPENLFIQSLIPEHAELGWIFNCFASFADVRKQTQFKDKSSKSEEKSDGFISVGLFDYPVLQAADILIYRADYVPVGKDQEQHLELSRAIANRFNNQVGKEYFVMPEGLYTETPKIRSTADPTSKMSKSAGEKHYINVFSDEAKIRKQIKSAVTDAGDTPEGQMSAGVENLFLLLTACGNKEAHASLMDDYKAGALRYSDMKQAVADTLVETLAPFQDRKEELKSNKKEIKNKIKYTSSLIRKRAQETLKEVKELTGLLNVKF